MLIQPVYSLHLADPSFVVKVRGSCAAGAAALPLLNGGKAGAEKCPALALPSR
jgi:hypothetical protein